jgi:para-nitrobenzyl esterase
MLSLDGDARRPVMVWIHGGAFVGGSGSTPWYDGGSFARRGGVVLVTLNYRLGAFGFLHLQDLAGEAFAGSGNAGILDQVAALRWVQQSIAAFGGDPDNVTIFGESAGAMSVGTLLGLPAARGLFRRAILQSGGAGNIKSAEAATEITERLLAALDLRPEQAEDLRALPPEALLAAQARVAEDTRGSGIPFEPGIDGAVLPRPVLDSIAAGDAAAVSMLAGTTLDEMRLFTAFDPAAAISDDADLLAHAQAIFGSEAAARAALTAYKSTRPEATASDIWSAILTDQVFRVPAVRLLDRQSRHQPQTWAYLFTWPTPVFDGRLGSCHALEIPFVFNTLEAPGAAAFTGGATPALQSLAASIHDAWVAFARTGDPNHAGLPAWPQYNPDRRATMLLNTTCAPSEELYAELPYWDTVAGADSPLPAPRAAGLR